MNYYKRHIGDYLKDTAHLSLLEHGIYTRLLDVYYTREGAIPDARAARLIGARTEEEREALQLVLTEFFTLIDGAWVQTRCDRELAEKEAKAETNRVNGGKGGRPRKQTQQEPRQEPKQNPEKTQSVSDENPNGFETETQTEPTENPSHKPLANSHKPISNGSSNPPYVGAEQPPAAAVSPGDSPPMERPVAMAVLIRNLERERNVPAKVTSSDPRLLEWAQAGVTDDQLREAYQLAVLDRELSDSRQPINAGFLDVFVAKVLTPPTAESRVGKTPAYRPGKPWFLTASGIEAKAQELGYTPAPDVPVGTWKGEVFRLAGVTEDEYRRAMVDFAQEPTRR